MMPRGSKQWVIRDRIPSEIDQALVDYPALFRQILYSRGIRTPEEAKTYLDCRPTTIHNLSCMKGLNEAVCCLRQAIEADKSIVIYGDYDVDGVTATALLVEVLRGYGAQVQPYIPNRFDEGYGLNIEALDKLAKDGAQLIVTVDCGIRSPREAEHARELGLELIISDHHQPGEELPQAVAVICPKQPDDIYPEKNLSGVGLAYKIAQGLAEVFPDNDVRIEESLDLVALGTVADIVPLVGENRVLVRAGLDQMKRTMFARPGLYKLAEIAGVKMPRISATDLAFILCPRLNAAGRLETAEKALKLLLATESAEIGKLVQELDNQNRQRQDLTRRTQEEVIQRMQEMEGKPGEHIVFAFDKEYNPGIVGLVAARLVDHFYRPAVVGHTDGEYTRASCRSIPEFHITQALDECRDLLVRHGGHALAAGFTIRNENIPALVERMTALARESLADLDLHQVLRADAEVPLVDLRPELLPYLDRMQPTGQENAEAVFVSRNLRVVNAKTVGAEGAHLRLTVTDGKVFYDGIAFRQGHWAEKLLKDKKPVDLMYVFEQNEFNGRVSLQLNVRDLKPSGIED